MKLDKAQVLLDEQPISIDVLLEKYAKGDEQTVDEVRRRVARGLAQVEREAKSAKSGKQRFYEADGRRIHSRRPRQLGRGHAALRPR